MHFFELSLITPAENLATEFQGFEHLAWSDFILNPRRLRGSDFLMRWSQGVWSEKRIIQAVANEGHFFALPYGPSGTAPDGDPRAYEQYFERLEKAGKAGVKRPDLLVFTAAHENRILRLVQELGGNEELPFVSEQDGRMQLLIENAALAIECENSLWKARQMPDFGTNLSPQKRLDGRPGLKKTAIVPTIILKEEDREPLKKWQREQGCPIHIWHVFYDMAYGISLDQAEQLIKTGAIAPTEQVYQAPGGATTKKVIYKIYYQHAYMLGDSSEEPKLLADSIVDKNGHILPYVRFEGGQLALDPELTTSLAKLASKRRK